MISLHNRAALERALTTPIRSDLVPVLHARIHRTLDAGLADLTHIVVVEGRDSEQTLLEELGFTPFANPIDGLHHDAHGFVPGWQWLTDLGGWFEMIWTIGNSGFAVILLIEDAAGPFAEMCWAYIVGNSLEPS